MTRHYPSTIAVRFAVGALILGVVGVSMEARATEGTPTTAGARANRVVGLWSGDGTVGPCGGPAVAPIRNTVVFNAGGTMVENAIFPPGGVPNVFGIVGLNQRSAGGTSVIAVVRSDATRNVGQRQAERLTRGRADQHLLSPVSRSPCWPERA